MSNGQEDGYGVFAVRPEDRADAIKKTLQLADQFGQIEGDHHRAWVIDQMTRALTGDYYDAFVCYHKNGENGPNTYSYDVGVPP